MTTFYHSEHLAQEGTQSRYGKVGVFKPINYDEAKKKLTKYSRSYSEFYLDPKSEHYVNESKVTFTFNHDRTIVVIKYELYSTKTGLHLTLANVTLSTIDSNCGSVLISNLANQIPGSKFGSILLEETIKYLTFSGYSYILLNTAGRHQNPLGDLIFRKRFGFTPLENTYVNKRSGNINIWYYKFLTGVQVVPLEQSLENSNHSDDEDFDEEDRDL